MISESKRLEIKRLLATTGLSQLDIAARVGVCRNTVTAISRGFEPTRELDPIAVDEPTGPLVRCGGCGGRTKMPCRVCRVRAAKSQKGKSCGS